MKIIADARGGAMTYRRSCLALAVVCLLALNISVWIPQPISVRQIQVKEVEETGGHGFDYEDVESASVINNQARALQAAATVPDIGWMLSNGTQVQGPDSREYFIQQIEARTRASPSSMTTAAMTLRRKKLASSQLDFQGIRKGNQPDAYMRIFGNILNNISQPASNVNYTASRVAYAVAQIDRNKLVNCRALLEGDEAAMKEAAAVVERVPKIPILEETYREWCRDCRQFKKDRGYILVPPTEEEELYPLAFSIAMYKDIEQTERLLRAIYQPQNLYCIHIDIRSPLLLHQTVYALVSCFPNVFVASHLDRVLWGDATVLLPAMNCMRDLLQYHRGKWKYFINLTGQEFPLRTNWELVQVAKLLNGSNDIGGSKSRMEMERVKYRWRHHFSNVHFHSTLYNTMEEKEPEPYNLTFYKGELHGVFAHKMVEFLLESEVGQNYFRWVSDTGHPTEHYWNTLNYNKHIKAPGGYEGPEDVADNYSINQVARAKHWVRVNYGNRRCEGQVARGICVYGLGDLPWLHTRPELVANKFYLTYHSVAYDCLEERHRNRTMMNEKVPFDVEYYSNLPTVKFGRKDGL